jgi:hypothetical protein
MKEDPRLYQERVVADHFFERRVVFGPRCALPG